jgi:predicted DNA helicase
MDLYEYTKKFKTLIARERNAEIDFHTNEIKTMNPIQREKKGRCFLGMQKQHTKNESESIFRFVKSNGSDLSTNEFSIGSNVLIGIKDSLDGLKGTVISKSHKHIDIYLPIQSNLINHNSLRIDLYVNDVTYQEQLKVLNDFPSWNFEREHIREILLHNIKSCISESAELIFFDDNLNESQKLAVRYSMREKNFYLIQGPPGTGKTKTSIEIIRQHLKEGKSVLVAADSNMAIDNIMLGLLKHVDVVRIGESPKILPEIQEHTLGNLIKDDIKYKIVEDGFRRIAQLKEKQRDHIRPTKKNTEGMSWFQIQKMAERGEDGFGISNQKLESMSEWIKAQEEIKHLQVRVIKEKKEIIKRCIEGANVICTTNTNANSEFLRNITFDLVLIDEAAQSTEPSCLIPISKSKKVILVGDHKQLPPTILSRDAQELSVSLFERMMNVCRYTLLDTQYRMHPNICTFPSNEFYKGLLKSFRGTSKHELPKNPYNANIVFIECFGEEKKYKGATSFYNPKEVDIVFDLILKYGEIVDQGEIGVISPYSQQVKKIQERAPFVDIHSIDGFQGREKRIIIISLVRSNERGEIGFLKDLRRLNVALTRPTDELIVVGNPKTISTNVTYKRFLEYVKEHGAYVRG